MRWVNKIVALSLDHSNEFQVFSVVMKLLILITYIIEQLMVGTGRIYSSFFHDLIKIK